MAGARRVYQEWKGHNKFLCGGRLIFGPDFHSFLATLFLIATPSIIFFVFVCGSLINLRSWGPAVLAIGIGLAVWDLFLLLMTSSRDPGIIPRNTQPPEPDPETPTTPSDRGRARLPRTKDVIVNGITVKSKYCDTCMLYRPPRCSHCSICNNCVDRFDHHCPWVGQCIGRRNYPFFFLFVSSTALLCAYVFSFSVVNIRLLMFEHNYNVLQAAGKRPEGPVSVVLMAYTFVAVWFVGGLTVLHSYLTWTNQTTYENFRYRYDHRANPYNLGGPKNVAEILCTPVPPSRNNFRAFVSGRADGRPSGNGQRGVDVGSREMQDLSLGARPLADGSSGGGIDGTDLHIDVDSLPSDRPGNGFHQL